MSARSASTRREGRSDRGAAAVEMALVTPLLFLIIFATIDFGRMIAAQITITQAAREGVRVWALGNGTATGPSASDVSNAVTSAASPLSGVSSSTTACTNGQVTRVTVTYTFRFITPVGAISSMFPGSPINASNKTLTATGAMECER